MSGVSSIGRMRYGFYDWACGAVADPPTPAAVEAYFAERGLRRFTREFWRNLLAGDLRQISIETWCTICDYAGIEFGYFFSYEPVGAPPPARRSGSPRPPRSVPEDQPFSKLPDLKELLP